MANGQVSEKEKTNYQESVALAKLKAMTDDMFTRLELQKSHNTARAAYQDAENQAIAKAQKEAEAQKQKAQQQGQQDKQKTMTENMEAPSVNPQNPTANVGYTDFSPATGFAQGPQGPNTGGSTDDMGLPGVGSAPPFLVNQRRQSEVGPHNFGSGLTAPARTTRTTTDIQPNVLSAAQRQQALLANAKARMEQSRWKQEQGQRERGLVTNTYLELAKEGIIGNTAGIATALQQGNVAEAERLMGGQKMGYQKLQEAKIRAADSQMRVDLARIGKLKIETLAASQTLLNEAAQRGLMDISGMTDYGHASLPGSRGAIGGLKLSQIIDDMNKIVNEDGKVDSAHRPSALVAASELYKRGLVVAYERPVGEGTWGTDWFKKSGTWAAPMSQVLADLEAATLRDDSKATQRLSDSGLFLIEDNRLKSISEVDPGNINAEVAGAVSRRFVYGQTIKDKTGEDVPVPEPEPLTEEEPAEFKEEEEEAAPFVGPTHPYPNKLQGWKFVQERRRRAREAQEQAHRNWLERARGTSGGQ